MFLNSLMQLVYKRYINNISKAILIENVTDSIIWNYYGKTDYYPFDVDYHTTQDGDKILSAYGCYKWDTQESKYKYQRTNVLRDHLEVLQEKINLNMEWHKAKQRQLAADQAKREMDALTKRNHPGKIELVNAMELNQYVNKFRRV